MPYPNIDPRLMTTLGLNALAAAGPTRTPQSFGSRLGQAGIAGMNMYDRQLQDAMRRKVMQKETERMDKQIERADQQLKLFEMQQKQREKVAKMVERMGALDYDADYMQGEEGLPTGNYNMNPWSQMAAAGIRAGDPTTTQLGLGGINSRGLNFTEKPGYGGYLTQNDIYGNPQFVHGFPDYSKLRGGGSGDIWSQIAAGMADQGAAPTETTAVTPKEPPGFVSNLWDYMMDWSGRKQAGAGADLMERIAPTNRGQYGPAAPTAQPRNAIAPGPTQPYKFTGGGTLPPRYAPSGQNDHVRMRQEYAALGARPSLADLEAFYENAGGADNLPPDLTLRINFAMERARGREAKGHETRRGR